MVARKKKKEKKKSMEIFLRDPVELVPKDVPPDKSVGARPSVQEKTTGIGNVGKSPCGGANDEHQSLKEQGNLRKHPVVANQEDTPTGERSGIETAILSSNYQDSLQSFYACHSTTAEFGMSDSEMEEMEGKGTVLTVRRETYLNSVESTVHAALKCCASIMILQESLNEVVPHVRDAMIRSMQQETTEFIRCSEQDPRVKWLLFKLRSNPQSRSTWLNFQIGLAQQERKWTDQKVSEDI